MILVYLFIAVLAFFILFLSISRYTKSLDENGADFANPTDAYQGFCEAIASELSALIKLLENDKIKAHDKAAALDQLDNFKRQILYTKNINLTKGKDEWQESLTKFLLKIDNYLEKSFVNGTQIADVLRQNLGKIFKSF